VQFRQDGGFPATRRRLFEAISVEPDPRKLSTNYAVRFCEIRAASQRRREERITSSIARSCDTKVRPSLARGTTTRVAARLKARLRVRLDYLFRPLSPLFGSLREAFVVLGDSQHRVLGIRVAHLLGDGARLFCALAPMGGVIDEGSRHL